MMSSRAKYALRAAVVLAERHAEGGWTLASDIAEAEALPKKFLEAILVELRDNGVLDSRRGRYGGYRLTRSPARVAAADVIRIVDGPLALTPCASKTQFAACDDCTDPRLCALQPMLRKARDAMAAVLDHTTLAELAQNRNR